MANNGDGTAAAALITGALAGYALYQIFSGDKKKRVINDPTECQKAVRAIKRQCNDFKVLAIDTEFTSVYRREPVALLQLKSFQNDCVLIQIQHMKQRIPHELVELLKDRRILKIGVGIDLDAKYLYDDYGIRVDNWFDLRYMAVLAKCQPGKLRTMAENNLKLKLNDDCKVSDWDANPLTDEQIEYAENDVKVSIELFKYFAERIYDGHPFRGKEGRIQYVIDNFCSKFSNLKYNGAQGIPHAIINRIMAH